MQTKLRACRTRQRRNTDHRDVNLVAAWLATRCESRRISEMTCKFRCQTAVKSFFACCKIETVSDCDSEVPALSLSLSLYDHEKIRAQNFKVAVAEIFRRQRGRRGLCYELPRKVSVSKSARHCDNNLTIERRQFDNRRRRTRPLHARSSRPVAVLRFSMQKLRRTIARRPRLLGAYLASLAMRWARREILRLAVFL